MAKHFVYVGDGLGIPGLPHNISDAEAEAQGLAELLTAAIAQGAYRELPTGENDAAPPARRKPKKEGE